MGNNAHRLVRLWVIVFVAGLLSALTLGCASVPKESVELSAVMGRDIAALHQSYRILIHECFEGYRRERLAYLDNEWTPLFMEQWLVDGHLLAIAEGREVYDAAADSFVAPQQGREREGKLSSITSWAQAAVEQIGVKREKLLFPLDVQERDLVAAVDSTFDRLYRGNAAITAHLNSLRKVQEVQDEQLSALGFPDIRVRFGELVSEASRRAAEGLRTVQEADSLLASKEKRGTKQGPHPW